MNRTEYYAFRHAIKFAYRKDLESFRERQADASYCDVPGRGPSSVRFVQPSVDALMAQLTPTQIIAVTARPSTRSFRETIQTSRTLKLRGPRPGVPFGHMDLNKRVALRAALKKLGVHSG